MKRRRSMAVTFALAAVLLSAPGCGTGVPADELDLTGPGYLQPGTEFWNGWKVPVGTVGIATPFPEIDPEPAEGLPDDKDRVVMDLLVTGEPNHAMRDLHAQVEHQGLRPVMRKEQRSTCQVSDRDYRCELYGQGEDGLTKLTAEMEIRGSPRAGEVPARLQLRFGEYTYFDVRPDYSALPGSENLSDEDIEKLKERNRTRWVEAPPPSGMAPVSPPDIDPESLVAGAEMPFYGQNKSVGTVPEGARLLAPSYNPAGTYGFSGTFVVLERHEQVLGELEAMAAEVSTGERYPDADLTAGDLTAHRVSFDGSAGGCGVEMDTVDLGSDVLAVRFNLFCD